MNDFNLVFSMIGYKKQILKSKKSLNYILKFYGKGKYNGHYMCMDCLNDKLSKKFMAYFHSKSHRVFVTTETMIKALANEGFK